MARDVHGGRSTGDSTLQFHSSDLNHSLRLFFSFPIKAFGLEQVCERLCAIHNAAPRFSQDSAGSRVPLIDNES